MDLDFNFKRPPATAGAVRELRESDFDKLLPVKGSVPMKHVAMREAHHNVARLLAAGMKPVAVASASGFTPGTISKLLLDPTFQELVTFYRTEMTSQLTDFGTRMGTLGLDASAVLHERLLDKPEEFTPGQLTEILKATADRTGFGVATKSTNINVNVDIAGRLERARERIRLHRLEVA